MQVSIGEASSAGDKLRRSCCHALNSAQTTISRLTESSGNTLRTGGCCIIKSTSRNDYYSWQSLSKSKQQQQSKHCKPKFAPSDLFASCAQQLNSTLAFGKTALNPKSTTTTKTATTSFGYTKEPHHRSHSCNYLQSGSFQSRGANNKHLHHHINYQQQQYKKLLASSATGERQATRQAINFSFNFDSQAESSKRFLQSIAQSFSNSNKS